MSKRRTTSFLAVRFNKVVNADVNTIDFLFRQERDEDSEPYLLKTYPTDVRYDRKADRYVIPWTQEETAMFLEDHEFFMDTRVQLVGGEIPETNIVKLVMNGTLFDSDSEYEFVPWKSGRSPYIGENGHWFEWDEEGDQWIDTGTKARGNGIYSVTQNDDKTITIMMDDGESYTTDPVQGEPGEKGDDGDAAVFYTLEPSDPVVLYDPEESPWSSMNSPSSVIFRAYKYENGVKSAYTASTITAIVTYKRSLYANLPDTTKTTTASNATSVTVATNAYPGSADITASYTDPNGNTISARVPAVRHGRNGIDSAIDFWASETTRPMQVGPQIIGGQETYEAIARPYSGSFTSASVGDLCVTGSGYLLKVTNISSSTVYYVCVADLWNLITCPASPTAGDFLVWNGVNVEWMSMADWQSTYGL